MFPHHARMSRQSARTDHIYGRVRTYVPVAFLPSAIDVPAWPHRGDPRGDLGHRWPAQAGKLMKKNVPGSLRVCPGA